MKKLLKIMNYIQENMERSKGDSSGYVELKSYKTRFEQIEFLMLKIEFLILFHILKKIKWIIINLK